MPTRKIHDLERICLDRDHAPPMHISLEPGVYEHECPTCRRRPGSVAAVRAAATWRIAVLRLVDAEPDLDK